MIRVRRTCPTMLCLLASAMHLAGVETNSLPTVKVLWTWPGVADAIAVADGVVYAAGDNRVTALNGRSGGQLWAREYPVESAGFSILRITGDRLVVGMGSSVVLADLKSGELRAIVPLGEEIQTIQGPPLVLDTWDGERYQIVSIDEKSGTVLARCAQIRGRGIDDFRVSDGTVIVLGDDEKTVAGLRPNDFKELWHTSLEEAGRFAVSEGTIGFQLGPADGETGFVMIDTRTGHIGPRLPQREGAGPLASAFAGLGLEVDVGSAGLDRSRVLSRYDPATGKALWSVTLPAGPTGIARGGDRLSIGTGSFAMAGTARITVPVDALTVVDWNSGHVVTRAVNPYGIGTMDSLMADGDLLWAISGHQEVGVFCLSSTQVDPPEKLYELLGQLLPGR